MINRLSPPQILVLGFLLIILSGSILLSTPWAVKNGTPDFLTAMFTSTSAVCVTGLVVVDTGTHWTSFGHLIIMLLFQIGGLGVMSFATFFALILGKRIPLRQRLMMQQGVNKSSLNGIVHVFRYLLIFSFIIELIGAIILFVYWFNSMGLKKALWYGIFHSVSAFNNAGFDLFGNFSSLTSFASDPTINLVISTLFITGALGFLVIYELLNFKTTRNLSLHSKIILLSTAILLFSGTFLILILEYNHSLQNLHTGSKLLAAFFQSASRTAGFATIDLQSTILPTQILILFLMFIGGSPGSTAGGIKVTTLALIYAAVLNILKGKKDIEIMERRIPPEDVFRALTILILVLFLIVIISFLLSLTHEADFMKILFEVVSATGTVGLSLGMTTELTSVGKTLIIIAMFLGRLGPLTIGYALAYQPRHPDIRYPEGKIIVG